MKTTDEIMSDALVALNDVFIKHDISIINRTSDIAARIGYYINRETKTKHNDSSTAKRIRSEEWDKFERSRGDEGNIYLTVSRSSCRFIGYRVLPNGRLAMAVFVWTGPTSWTKQELVWDGRVKIRPIHTNTEEVAKSFRQYVGMDRFNEESTIYDYDPLLSELDLED